MKAPIVAVIVIVVLAAAVGAYYYVGGQLNLPSYQQPAQTQQNVPAKTMSGLDVAKQIMSFVDSQRNADGFYTYSFNCGANCPFDKVYNTTNTWTVYANLGMYRATGDKSYLEQAKKDGDKIVDWCGNSNVKNCLWILIQMKDLYDTTKDTKYSSFVASAATNLVNVTDVSNVMLRGIESRELATAYGLTGDPVLLAESKLRLNASENLYQADEVLYGINGNKYYSLSCWPQLAKLELYKTTNDSRYLNDVKNNFDSLAYSRYAKSFLEMNDMQPCIDTNLVLFEMTGNSTYMRGAENLAQNVISDFWDSKNTPIGGSNLILHSRNGTENSLTDSAYMVYLLSKMKDSKFEVGQ